MKNVGITPWDRGFRRLLLTSIVLCLLAFGAPPASAVAPVVTKTRATQVGVETATLNALVDPEEKSAVFFFEYGLAPCSTIPNPCVQTSKANLPKGGVPVPVSALVEGLSPATTYFFRAVAQNGDGTTLGPDKAFTTLFFAPAFPPCPNDALRKGPTGGGPGLRLPDCRAYEQASPVDKNGTSLLGEHPPLRASLDGEAIVFESSSGIPGGEGAQNFPYYLATRGASDWSTQGILPHGSTGDEAKVLGWTRDLSLSFSRAQKSAAKEQALLARSSAGGSLETVVDYTDLGNVRESPLLPGTFLFAGAADDGSTVYFEATGPKQGDLSPEAAFNRNNLYAWERDTDELRLAGVLPDGSTPPGGSLAGSYDWVKGTDKASLATGGALRRYYTQDTHAVSEDGKRAFFTAGDTGQLYLREEATEPTAQTLNVSKSKKNDGEGSEGRDAAGTRPAAFMAATPDGSHAFFTSSEKLTNDATTGPEPDVFAAIARAPADDGNPLEIGCLPTTADWVDVDSTNIYWTDTEAGTIGRADLDCDEESIEPNFISLPEIEIEKEPTKEPGVLTPSAPNPQDLAVNATHIYWTNATDGKKGTGTIGRVELDGDDLKAECVKGASNPMGIDVNATDVYWANALKISSNKGTIGQAKLDCTGANQEAILPDGSSGVPKGVALGITQIYWTMDQTGFANLVRANLDGSEQKSIGLGPFEARGLALNSTHVFWADGDDNSIGKAKLDFSEEDKTFIEDAGTPIGVAANEEHVYWAANQEVAANPGNDLYRYEPDTKELVDLVGGGPAPNGAEVRGVLGVSEDGSRAYFVANGDLDGGGPATKGDCKGPALEGSGECNLYLWEEGVAGHKFIARLAAGGAVPVNDALNWAPTTLGATVLRTDKTSRLSADGGVLVFRSSQKLSDYDNEGVPHFYRYVASTGDLSCLTCNQSGAPEAAPTLGSINAFLSSAGPPASTLARNLSADGARFFFETTEALVGEDTNGQGGCPDFKAGANEFPSCRDVYLWEEEGTGSCTSATQNGGCLYLISTGTEAKPSFFGDADVFGDNAFLVTAQPGLAFQDKDALFDVYDARVEGGLQAQNQLPPIFCEGEGCKPAPPPPPAQEAPATPGFVGPADPVPDRQGKACPKGKRKVKVKGKVRCVRKGRRGAKGKGKKQRRAAKTSGRAGQ